MTSRKPSRPAHAPILADVAAYYSAKLATHGATPRGVDWNSAESQHMRFTQLLRIVDLPSDANFSILDWGCGFGALREVVRDRWPNARYVGFDIAPDMVAAARARHRDDPRATFTTDVASLAACDYVVASGIFNVRLGHAAAAWQGYILDTLAQHRALCTRGFAFNVLTSWSDAEFMRPDLHYADPTALFDHCKRTFSRHVALLHDYPLYEFTLLVRVAVG